MSSKSRFKGVPYPSKSSKQPSPQPYPFQPAQQQARPVSSQKMQTVPMSVYRELAGELQATKSELEGLKQQNLELSQQNQHLRLELNKLIKAVQKVEHNLHYWEQPSQVQYQSPRYYPQSANYEHPYYHPYNEQGYYPQTDPNLIATETEYQLKGTKTAKQSQEINGWVLLGVVILIIISFAGLGFFVARPLLEGNVGNDSE